MNNDGSNQGPLEPTHWGVYRSRESGLEFIAREGEFRVTGSYHYEGRFQVEGSGGTFEIGGSEGTLCISAVVLSIRSEGEGKNATNVLKVKNDPPPEEPHGVPTGCRVEASWRPGSLWCQSWWACKACMPRWRWNDPYVVVSCICLG
jgi:hypothetical protein